MTCNAESKVFGGLTLTLTHLLAKTNFFQRVWGVYIRLVEIPEGLGGGLFLCSKNGNYGGRGYLNEIPSVVVVWILSGTTQCKNKVPSVVDLDSCKKKTGAQS